MTRTRTCAIALASIVLAAPLAALPGGSATVSPPPTGFEEPVR